MATVLFRLRPIRGTDRLLVANVPSLPRRPHAGHRAPGRRPRLLSEHRYIMIRLPRRQVALLIHARAACHGGRVGVIALSGSFDRATLRLRSPDSGPRRWDVGGMPERAGQGPLGVGRPVCRAQRNSSSRGMLRSGRSGVVR